MSAADHFVHQTEAFVGSILSVGVAAFAVGQRQAAASAAQDQAHLAYLSRVDHAAREAVRAKTAGTLSGTAALIAAYNRNRASARG